MNDHENFESTGVYAPEVVEFVKSANAYCKWLEEPGHSGSMAFIRASLQMLSRVYYTFVNIDKIEPVMENSNEKFVTEEDWSLIYQDVMNLLGKHNEYLRIADDNEFDRSDLVSHKISEDLADIYQDLKNFTLQYRQGVEEIMNDAVWEVMDNFENYWGGKLLNALQALNKLYVLKIDPEANGGSQEISEDEENRPAYDNSLFTRMQDLNREDV